MHARSTTVTGVDPARIDEGVAVVRDEILPAVMTMPGCTGLSMLVDRTSARCIVTTAWDSGESMSATASRVRDLRQRVAEVMGGRYDVQEWEIAVLHRAHEAPDAAACRVTWVRGDPERIDDMTAAFRTSMIPRVDELPGFASLSLLVDRRRGMTVLAAVYDDHAALGAAGGTARTLREQFTEKLGMEIIETAEMELAIAHLRVPEMA
jgi:quinol monooxygenase YgiN